MTESMSLRARKQERTRRLIERTALELFAGQGFEQTTIAQIAAKADIAERTFFSYFDSKEDVVLGDIADEMTTMASVLDGRDPGVTVLQLFRDLGDRRVALFHTRTAQVIARRVVEDANPGVHARAVAVREQAEHDMLTPAFALDLGLPPEHPHVRLLVAAFTGISAALDGMFLASPHPAAARQVLDSAITALQTLQASLQATPPSPNPG